MEVSTPWCLGPWKIVYVECDVPLIKVMVMLSGVLMCPWQPVAKVTCLVPEWWPH